MKNLEERWTQIEAAKRGEIDVLAITDFNQPRRQFHPYRRPLEDPEDKKKARHFLKKRG